MKTMSSRSLALVLVAVIFALNASARVSPPDPRLERINELFRRPVLQTPGGGIPAGSSQTARPARLGAALSAPNSRGGLVAQTWQDWQANANQNRWVAVTEPQSSFGAGVQFVYEYKASGAPTDLVRWNWNGFDGISGIFVKLGPCNLLGNACSIVQEDSPGSAEAGYYPKVVTNPSNGQGVVGGYDLIDQLNAPNHQEMRVSWESIPFSGVFGTISDGSVIPDSINQKENISGLSKYTLWPAMGMTCTASDTVLYLFGFEGAVKTSGIGAVKVFRRDLPLGLNGTTFGYPDDGWQLVFTDSSFAPTCDFSASRLSSKVAAVWTKWSPSAPLSTTKVDVYYATSPTGLAGTWTRQNLTNYTGNTYRAWVEVNSLYDSADKLHIIWNAGTTSDNGTTVSRACRLFHWSEFNPGSFYTMYNAEFDPATLPCVGGSNVLNVGKFSLGECNGRLYGTFVDWNDPNLADSTDDCAHSADPMYGANGELWFVVSKDLQGKTWDQPRNLSNNMTPGCDTTSGAQGGDCADDRWNAISEHGIDDALYPGTENWPPAGNATYDPSGSYSGTEYIQVFYLTDRFPGGAELAGQGPYTLNDLRWIRLACVDQIPAGILTVSPSIIDFPAATKPGVELDTVLTLRNVGTVPLTFSPGITKFEDGCSGPGCVSGWLGITFPPVSISEGAQGIMTLRLNMGGVSNVTSGPTVFRGHLQMNYGPPSTTFNYSITLIVADSIANSVWDTITTSTNVKLAVASNGNMGNNYAGRVNLNFNPPVECDHDSSTSGPNFSRGNAKIYLGDASPVIIRKPGSTSNLIGSWSIFGQGYTSDHGFKPLPPASPYGGKSPLFKDTTMYQRYFSGTFTTVDSTLRVEKTWYAPKTSPDTNNFVIEKMQIWPNTAGAKVDSLYIGEAYDWDIPTDSGPSKNYGGFDATRRLVYQQGFESSDTISTKGYECANNATRYGGSALIVQSLTDACSGMYDSLWGGYTAANDSFVYPTGGFIPVQLYDKMRVSGYSNESRITDQHTVLVFRASNLNPPAPATGWTLPATVHDTLTVYTIMGVVYQAATPAAGLDSLKAVIDKGKKWFDFYLRGCKCCCYGKRGNVNCTGAIDLADLSALVKYLTGAGFVLCDASSANVNGIGAIDLGDLTALVSYLTGGGFVLVDCP